VPAVGPDPFTDYVKDQFKQMLVAHTKVIYNSIKAEAFISGLPQTMYDRLKNKKDITNAKEMFDFLNNEEKLRQAEKSTSPSVSPVDEIVQEDIDAAAPRQGNRPNGGNGGNYRPNGNGNGNNRGRGYNSRGGNRNGYNRSGNNGNNRNGNSGNNGNGQYYQNGEARNNDPRNGNGQARNSAREYKFSQNGNPICHYCGISNHMQKQCFKRQAQNKPCVKPDGTTWYPVNQVDSVSSVFPQ
jgi:hypothetical protein